jgi:transcriptional regulator with XRE-family HTH domain
MNIGEKIKNARVSKHISQKKLADLIGISQQNIAVIEKGHGNINFAMIEKIAVALDMDVLQLIPTKYANDNFYELLITCELFNDDTSNRLLEHLLKLNNNGKLKAMEIIELFSKIPDFQAEPATVSADSPEPVKGGSSDSGSKEDK